MDNFTEPPPYYKHYPTLEEFEAINEIIPDKLYLTGEKCAEREHLLK